MPTARFLCILSKMDSNAVVSQTRDWITRVVIGLDLCPFAAEPLRAGRIRFVVHDGADAESLAEVLAIELQHLDRAPPDEIETTILVHPNALRRFEAFNDFLAVADRLLAQLGLEGTLQIASFHPDYRFAGCTASDPANATNRSPFPMLHLLREASVERAVGLHPDPGGIPERNAARLRGGARLEASGLTPPDRPRASARGRSSE